MQFERVVTIAGRTKNRNYDSEWSQISEIVKTKFLLSAEADKAMSAADIKEGTDDSNDIGSQQKCSYTFSDPGTLSWIKEQKKGDIFKCKIQTHRKVQKNAIY